MLPYQYKGDLVSSGGTVEVTDMPVMVWPAGNGRAEVAGEVFDHTGECPARYKTHFGTNRKIVIADGPMAGTYVVVTAIVQQFVPHMALRLRAARSGG